MYIYKASVLEIIDGDTVKFVVPLSRVNGHQRLGNRGFHTYVEEISWNGPVARWLVLHAPMRFLGLNAPEHTTPEGQASISFLKTLINVGDVVTLQSALTTHDINPDKYGDRWDAVIIRTDGLNVNDTMISSGHAFPWDGKGAKPTS